MFRPNLEMSFTEKKSELPRFIEPADLYLSFYMSIIILSEGKSKPLFR